jgi:Zn-dependent M28 family amino/carboxypeptidase
MTGLDEALTAIRAEVLDAHLRFLADPLLEGRAPGTRGGRLAAAYIRAQFRRIGLHPLADDYLPPVPLVGLDPEPSLGLELPSGEGLHPTYGEDFVANAGVPESDVELSADLVYVGFGIRAPEYEWDDYEGLDVRGKVVLVRVNDPGSAESPDFFGGEALTYYGRWTYKFEEAARQGAAGAILIHTDESAGYGWNVVRSSNTGEQFSLAGQPEHPLPLKAWVRATVVGELLQHAGLNPEELDRRSQQRGFRGAGTGVRVRARLRSRIRTVETGNVVGLLPGRDGSRSDEPVLVTSHYDHLAPRLGPAGEAIVYPGAYDNASGVAVLLAVAEAAARLPAAPRRPWLFIATTAEESGLLGAEWYARHPLIPLARTVAALNLDGANLMGRTRDLAPLGLDRSELGELVGEAAAAEGMELAPEPHPEQGMFFRQDHFPFARAGVPALALDHGLVFEGRPAGWGEAWYQDFVANHYHQPSDSYRDGIDYGGAVQQARVLLRLASAASERERLPDWSPHAEFSRPA